MWAGKSVGKCILFESKWIVPTVFENQLEISSANKWRSINYDGKIVWGVGLAKTQQDQIVATHPRTTRITITFGALPQSQQEVHTVSCLNTDFWLSE